MTQSCIQKILKNLKKKREKEKKNLFKQINELSNIADQYTKPLCFSTLGMDNLKMKLRKQFLLQQHQNK